jgi:OTU domain-containing protein 7
MFLAMVPITDSQHRLLPVHFACDPGADFTWWSDAADERIAAAAQLDQIQRLAIICRYMDVEAVDVSDVNGHTNSTRNQVGHFK